MEKPAKTLARIGLRYAGTGVQSDMMLAGPFFAPKCLSDAEINEAAYALMALIRESEQMTSDGLQAAIASASKKR